MRGAEEFVGGDHSPLAGAGKWRQGVLLGGPARVVGKVEGYEGERGLVDGLVSELGLGSVATGGEGEAEVGSGGEVERLLEVVAGGQVVSVRCEEDDFGHPALLGPAGLVGVGVAAVADFGKDEADAASDDGFRRDVAQSNGHGAEPGALDADGAVEADGPAVDGNRANRDRPGGDAVGVAEGEGDVRSRRGGPLRACRNDEKHGCPGEQPAAREASKHGSSPGLNCTASVGCEGGCRNIPITLKIPNWTPVCVRHVESCQPWHKVELNSYI